MITIDMILSMPEASYNYIELCKMNSKSPEAFPPNYLPKLVESKPSTGQIFFERSAIRRDNNKYEESLFLLINAKGELFEDSYSRYVEIPSYPCYVTMVTRSLDDKTGKLFDVSYIADVKDTRLIKISSSKGIIFAIDTNINNKDWVTTKVLDAISTKAFLKTL